MTIFHKVLIAILLMFVAVLAIGLFSTLIRTLRHGFGLTENNRLYRKPDRDSTPPATDPWTESARRVRVDPMDDTHGYDAD